MTYDGETLAEFEHGKSSGWLYYVNGELPKVGIADYTLKAGDKVEWLYTSDYKQESGGSSMGGGSRREPDTKTDEKPGTDADGKSEDGKTDASEENKNSNTENASVDKDSTSGKT